MNYFYLRNRERRERMGVGWQRRDREEEERRENKEVPLGQEICCKPRHSRRWAPEEYTGFAFADLKV